MGVKRAGPISGNPTYGLCFKECIEVTKVIDGCMTRIADIAFTMRIREINAPFPFTFIRAVSNGLTTLNNVMVTPIEGRRSRIAFDATIPVTVLFADADGIEHSANSAVGIHREVVLNLPNDSLTPYEFRASSSLVSLYGTFTSPTEASVRCCVMQIVKVVAMVEILVPSYGYCEYPVCDEVEDGNGCEALSNLPLFPPFS